MGYNALATGISDHARMSRRNPARRRRNGCGPLSNGLILIWIKSERRRRPYRTRWPEPRGGCCTASRITWARARPARPGRSTARFAASRCSQAARHRPAGTSIASSAWAAISSSTMTGRRIPAPRPGMN